MDLPREYRNNLLLQFQKMGKHLRDSCKLCSGEGVLPADGYGIAKRCPDCMGKFDEYKKYIYSGLSPDYLKATLEDSDYTRETKHKLQRINAGYSHLFGQINIIFHKVIHNPSAFTLAGVLLLRKFVEAGHQCFYVDFSQLFDFFLNFKDDGEYKTKMVQFCTQVPVLMIDNFCNNFFKSETKEGFLFQNLEKLLRMRTTNGFTILSTNLKFKELHDQFTLISPVIKQYFQPIELYSTVDKAKMENNLLSAKIPTALKNIFKGEINKINPTEENALNKIAPKKSPIDDISRS